MIMMHGMIAAAVDAAATPWSSFLHAGPVHPTYYGMMVMSAAPEGSEMSARLSSIGSVGPSMSAAAGSSGGADEGAGLGAAAGASAEAAPLFSRPRNLRRRGRAGY